MASRYKAEKYTWTPYDSDWNRIVPTFKDVGITSFYDYQQKYYLDYHFLNADHQKEWGLLIDSKAPKTMINEPRDSGKSVTWSTELPIYKFIEDYNSAGLLLTASDKLSKTYIRSIIDTMQKNPLLIKDFHTDWWFDMKKGREGYSAHEIHLKRTTTRREPSFMTAGVGSAIIGYHPNYAILDDIIEDMTSGIMRGDKLKDWVRKVLFPMEPEQIYIIGTRKGPDDIYQFFKDMKIFDLSTRSALSRIPRYEVKVGEDDKMQVVLLEKLTPLEQGELVYWPEKYSLLDLLKIREIIGAEAFSGEYQNDPIPTSGQTFENEWLEYYDYNTFINSPQFAASTLYTVLDPAGSSERSDYNALVTLAFYGTKIYIIEVKYGHWKPLEIIKQIKQTYVRWRKPFGKYPTTVGVEAEFMQGILIDLARAKGLHYVPFQELYPGRTAGSKKARLNSLASPFSLHSVLISEGMLGIEEFKKEFLLYDPEKLTRQSRNRDRVRWDVLDALQQCIQMGTGGDPALVGYSY